MGQWAGTGRCPSELFCAVVSKYLHKVYVVLINNTINYINSSETLLLLMTVSCLSVFCRFLPSFSHCHFQILDIPNTLFMPVHPVDGAGGIIFYACLSFCASVWKHSSTILPSTSFF